MCHTPTSAASTIPSAFVCLGFAQASNALHALWNMSIECGSGKGQVLQVVEALLKQSELLTGPPHATLPYASPASIFLDTLAERLSGKLHPGQVSALLLCSISRAKFGSQASIMDSSYSSHNCMRACPSHSLAGSTFDEGLLIHSDFYKTCRRLFVHRW